MCVINSEVSTKNDFEMSGIAFPSSTTIASELMRWSSTKIASTTQQSSGVWVVFIISTQQLCAAMLAFWFLVWAFYWRPKSDRIDV